MIPVIKNERLIKFLQKLVSRRATERIVNVAKKLHPNDLSSVIPYLTPDGLQFYLNTLYSIDLAGRTLIEVQDEDILKKALNMIEDEKLAKIIEKVSSDDAVDFLGLLPEERKTKILEIIKKSEEYEELLSYPEDSCGGIMSKEYLALNENLTIGEALNVIKKSSKKDTAFYLYIVNENNQLTGVLSLRSLILLPSEKKIREVMTSNVVRVNADDPQKKAAALISNYDLLSLPVTDEKNQLIGVITVDDIIDIIEEEANEELLHLSGVGINETLFTPLVKSFKYRFPWLIINLLTALLAASVIDFYKPIIEKYVALAVFLPIIAGMGGNAAMQVMSITVRQVSFMVLSNKEFYKVLLKEFGVALLIGIGTGILLGAVAIVYYGSYILFSVCLLALIGNVIIANLTGFLVPYIIKVSGHDPALISSIFVTTFTDIGGFFIFLTLAKIMMKL